MNTMTKLKIDRLKAMHNFMINANDEDCYTRWINVVPDCPLDEDFEYIAEHDSDYKEVCDLFKKIVADGDWD